MRARRPKDIAKGLLLRLHLLGLRLRLVILPLHFYVPFPDLRELRRNRRRWARRSGLAGLRVDLDEQLANLRRICGPHVAECAGNPALRHAVQAGCGPGYGYIEAQALHGFIRGTRPARICEVGSGVSTYCALEAIRLNMRDGGPETRVTCVEPHPSEWLRSAPVELIAKRVQEIEPDFFRTLGEGDLLFIDSSHTVRTDGDVNFLLLEVLPRLRPGVVVHFHDIYLPYDYQRVADRTIFQWMETAMLHAFLIDNRRASILFCLSHLHYDRPGALGEIFPEYRPQPGRDGLREDRYPVFGPTEDHFPSSIFIEMR